MERARARDLGIEIGLFPTGSRNAITDVAGVRVGHATIVEGEGALVPGRGPARTGVTVILPRPGDLFREKVHAGCHVLNGFGKSTGFHQIRELGALESPIALTNTLNVPLVSDALVEWSCARAPEIGVTTGTVNPVVGDINDGFLSDIQGRHVRRGHVLAAIEEALAAEEGARVAEGNIGGGTGCCCLGFKGGVGTSSRRLPERFGGWTVGVLAQTNFGGALSVNGAPVGRTLGVHAFSPPAAPARRETSELANPGLRDGSCMVVVATDAPLDGRLLGRVAKRCGLGLSRTGFYSSNGSGDFFIAFSAAQTVPHAGERTRVQTVVSDDHMSAIFAATVEAVEEAVINSLTMAETMTGRDGNTSHALPLDELARILDAHNARHWSSKLPPLWT